MARRVTAKQAPKPPRYSVVGNPLAGYFVVDREDNNAPPERFELMWDAIRRRDSRNARLSQ